MTATTFSLVLLLFAQLISVNAHTYLSSISINGNSLNEGDCIRPQRPTNKEYPIMDVKSADMTCGFVPWNLQPANRKCPIAAGSTVGLQWYHNQRVPGGTGDAIIAESHHGPCMVYMAKSDSGSGNVWFKIYEEGYDFTSRTWCVDRLRANGGLLTFTIPSDIAPGNYLIRGEMIALHEGYALGLSQQYVGCAEVTVSGSGTANPSGVAFPGYYSETDPGILFDIYSSFSRYVIPGPAVYRPGTSTSAPATPAPATPAPATPAPATPAPATPAPATPAPATPAPATPAPATPAPATPAPATQAPATPAPVTQAPATPAPATPSPTTRPGSGATNAPVPTGGITVQLSSSTSPWWIAVAVNSGSTTTTGVEIKDAKMSSYANFESTSWGYWVYSPSSELSLPITIRVTSSSRQQVVLTNVITSFTNFAVIQTGASYGGSTTAPVTPAPATQAPATPAPATQAPATPAPATPAPATPAPATPAPATPAPATPAPATPAPATQAPATSAPGSTVAIEIHPGASEWWFAVAVKYLSNIARVEIRDSRTQAWTLLTETNWGYYVLTTQNGALVSPVSVRITASNGKQATISTPIRAGAIVDSGVTL